MADDLDLDLDINPNQEEISKTEKRIKDLSEKVKLTSQERDELVKTKETLEAEKATLAKEADFFKNFNTLMPKYSGAADYQDKIKEKVMSGYEIEDATISILAKEGKLNTSGTSGTQISPRENPAGGSAVNTITPEGDKSLGEMSRDEKRSALSEREGDLLKIFNRSL